MQRFNLSLTAPWRRVAPLSMCVRGARAARVVTRVGPTRQLSRDINRLHVRVWAAPMRHEQHNAGPAPASSARPEGEAAAKQTRTRPAAALRHRRHRDANPPALTPRRRSLLALCRHALRHPARSHGGSSGGAEGRRIKPSLLRRVGAGELRGGRGRPSMAPRRCCGSPPRSRRAARVHARGSPRWSPH